MPLTEIDLQLLERCLQHKPRAWEDFVDRFLGLVTGVVRHSARTQGVRLSREDRDDLCAEVFLSLLKDNLDVLRHFRGRSSLATYVTVVARRVVVNELLLRGTPAPASPHQNRVSPFPSGTNDNVRHAGRHQANTPVSLNFSPIPGVFLS